MYKRQVPIWRIDDGAVYGIPYEQCQLASQPKTSDKWDAVHTGPQPSWPDLQCANVSYAGPDKTYSHVVSLAEGPHTLWTGLLVMRYEGSLGWQQAWIELVDTIGPLYPNPPETRHEQFPGCTFGVCVEPDPLTNPACSEWCPPGAAMWTSYDFRVTSGKGGGIATPGPRLEMAREFFVGHDERLVDGLYRPEAGQDMIDHRLAGDRQ